MSRQSSVVANVVLSEVSCRLRACAEIGGAFNPPHLNRRWDHNPRWLSRLLWEDIGKVIAIVSPHNEAPTPVTDIQLGEKDPLLWWDFPHVLQQSGEDLADLLHGGLWPSQHRGVIDALLDNCGHSFFICLVHWKREVQNNSSTATHLWDNRYRRDV